MERALCITTAAAALYAERQIHSAFLHRDEEENLD